MCSNAAKEDAQAKERDQKRADDIMRQIDGEIETPVAAANHEIDVEAPLRDEPELIFDDIPVQMPKLHVDNNVAEKTEIYI